MSFRGLFGFEGLSGESSVILSATADGAGSGAATPLNLPAGADRWRVFAVWMSVSGILQSAAAGANGVDVVASVFEDDSFINLAQWGVPLAGADGFFDSQTVAGQAFHLERGIALPAGANIELLVTNGSPVGGLSNAGAQEIASVARAVILCRPE